ncbi:hypothetical protein Asp14428_57430 [Actinoplanes sp. NBRC 14428]|uniref:Uncharacterized protein n=1 Tax=Pseudosporangium ferrugineum TaxID=439699 RepID=A0A2T0SDV0_9ACTN|nr:hypothetical protein [Pseudosporangium ferrugineum]PRY31584.1 hypothetical protein CLV70_103473 [Pseudosporangium ferrugineum]BCJ54268.1 hypothetical protein Asp14428_57430 [Actinoplanes sp. NBRC 14428]
MDHLPPADRPRSDRDALYRRPNAVPPAYVPEPPMPAALPSISDYWPDAPHRQAPVAPAVPPRPHRQPVAPAPRPRRRRTGLVLVTVVVLLAAGGVAGAYLTRRTDPPRPAAAPPPVARTTTTAAPVRNRLAAPVSGLDRASFELVSDTRVLRLRTTDLGDDLYRVTTPEGGSVLPRVTVEDTAVRLFLERSGQRGKDEVEVLLNTAVRWRLTMTGGVQRGAFDLGGARIEGVNLVGGATRLELTLPRPDGTLPIRMSGGVNQFEVSAAPSVPVRVRTRRGAGQVKFDGRTDDGVARGAAFLSPDWGASRNRVDLDAVAGVGTLRLGRA